MFYFSGFSWAFFLFLSLFLLPGVHAATTDQTPFSNISFQHFSNFVQCHFSPHISLATALLVLFSLIENPDLLNLHARQAHPAYHNEKKIQASSWLKCLSQLHGLSELLQLTLYNSTGQFQKKLRPISLSEIEPIWIICPISMTCTTSTCKPVHLEQLTRT